MNKIRVIIPAAGKGTRLQAIRGSLPKAMYPINNKPMLEIVLENTSFVPQSETYIVVGYKKDDIINYFGSKYHYVEQTEQLGTGHAVMQCADEFRDFDGSVLITFGDMPLFRYEEMKRICRQHQLSNADCTIMTAKNPELTMWARILRNEDGSFKAIIEGQDCTPEQAQITELFSGVLVFDSKALFSLLPEITPTNAQKEYYLTAVPELMAKKGMKVDTFFIQDGNDLRGVNIPEDLKVCERILKQRSIK